MKLQNRMNRNLAWLVAVLVTSMLAGAEVPRVTTVAGGFLGDGGPATSASFAFPTAVARDSKGDLYVADARNCRIRRVSAQGVITTFAGTGICGYSGDGGEAKSARLQYPNGITFDRRGDLLVAAGSSVRSISPTGVITTVAGGGKPGYSGDGGPATKAALNGASGVSVDPAGDVYIADSNNNAIRKIDAAGVIHTVAGNHTAGFSGDGGPATSASLRSPSNVLVDAAGDLYISDSYNWRVRKVDSTGTINTYAGDGLDGATGSGGPAIGAAIGYPVGLRLDAGKLYISTGLGFIWAVDLNTQIINIVAGTGVGAFNGDGNRALATSFNQPNGLISDGAGGLFVADSGNNRLRHLDSNQTVTTVAGGGIADGGPATGASLNFSSTFSHIAFDPEGNLYIADIGNCRIRKVSTSGIISTFAGVGLSGYGGDNGPARSAYLNLPEAVAADVHGNIYIADTGNNVIRKVDSGGTITTFLTEFTSGTSAESARAVALAFDSSGNLYASDGLFAIWKITSSGTSTIVAGILYNLGYNGDGIPATQASLFLPTGVAVDKSGNVFVSDWLNNRIRKVDTSGIISTIAGTGISGFSGDGGPGTSAELFEPSDVATDSAGNIYIADWINYRVRVLDSSGTINTVAGSGGYDYNGNDVLAAQAHLLPNGLAVRDNIVYFSDESTYRVRKIE
jgi:sugar lactone lactonase YvrE